MDAGEKFAEIAGSKLGSNPFRILLMKNPFRPPRFTGNKPSKGMPSDTTHVPFLPSLSDASTRLNARRVHLSPPPFIPSIPPPPPPPSFLLPTFVFLRSFETFFETSLISCTPSTRPTVGKKSLRTVIHYRACERRPGLATPSVLAPRVPWILPYHGYVSLFAGQPRASMVFSRIASRGSPADAISLPAFLPLSLFMSRE